MAGLVASAGNVRLAIPEPPGGLAGCGPGAPFMCRKARPRNNHARSRAKDSRVDSNDSITIFFFTDSVWGLRGSRLKLVPRVAGLSHGFHRTVMVI